jgi:hypothetical protein
MRFKMERVNGLVRNHHTEWILALVESRLDLKTRPRLGCADQIYNLRRVLPSMFAGYTYRVIDDVFRTDPLSGIGSVINGGRYNAPRMFEALYSSDSRITLQTAQAQGPTTRLHATRDGPGQPPALNSAGQTGACLSECGRHRTHK